MKKKFLSTLLALTMCLTLLPTAAFADETEGEVPVCTCETACAADAMNADCPVCSAEGAAAEGCGKYAAPAQPETDEAAEAVREMIAALPTAESWAALSAHEQNVAGEAAYAAFDAYGALADGQQKALMEEYSLLMALLTAMNGEVSTLANATWDTSILPDYSSTTMFEVSTAAQLLAIATSGNQFSGKTIKLMADIDMKDVTGWKPLGGTSGFLGTFDGDGHSISNLNGTLFGKLQGATVKNLAVVDSMVSGADSKSTGILANSATANNNSSTPCTIRNCYVTGTAPGRQQTRPLVLADWWDWCPARLLFRTARRMSRSQTAGRVIAMPVVWWAVLSQRIII